MATNFFSQQDLARRNTRILIVLFSVAVLLLIGLTNLLLLVSLGMIDPQWFSTMQGSGYQLPWQFMAWTSLLVLGAVGVAVLVKWQQLKQGGRTVAEALGGRRLAANSDNPAERQLLNVVEEMAIAANLPVPPVYVLPEPGINAFAAGYSPADAVIGITQGSMEQLNRDELQGVVAHEFSHILNGDMRMNIRMIAVLNGILFIGHIGYTLLRSSRGARIASLGRNNRNNNAGGIVILAVGLIIIGYLGSFFGNLIKAAVSRQREYLADASAVQFSRNPRGIAGALKRIGAHSAGSQVKNENADEISHLFFGEAISRWASIFATHPPLSNRIKRLEPHWNGKFPSSLPAPQPPAADAAAQAAEKKTSEQQQRQQFMLASLPVLLTQSCRQPLSAQAIVCAVLLQPGSVEQQQLRLIKEMASAALLQQVDQLCDFVLKQPLPLKVQLLQRCIPTLKEMSEPQFVQFQQLIQALAAADQQLSLLEWIAVNFIDHTVGSQFDQQQLVRRQYISDLDSVLPSSLMLLAAVASCAGDKAKQAQSWQAALKALALDPDTAAPELDFKALSTALPCWLAATPMLKQHLWQAVLAAANADQQLAEQELALLKALALLLEIPWQATN
ncbi:M48 family metallopeptidase [Arsukibacterium sp.]|uniref:M48 family metallopeptidase n=1 Tax=Arsukibacterium sp. TaxID=1977258 RepID=UPI002FDAC6A4